MNKIKHRFSKLLLIPSENGFLLLRVIIKRVFLFQPSKIVVTIAISYLLQGSLMVKNYWYCPVTLAVNLFIVCMLCVFRLQFKTHSMNKRETRLCIMNPRQSPGHRP